MKGIKTIIGKKEKGKKRNMDDFHKNHGSHDKCNCKANVVAQTLDELDFERGIWTAAIENDLNRLKMFVNRNEQNVTDNNGYTALHYAARNGHFEACQILLAARVNVNAITKSGGVTSLMRASMMGHEKIVQLLIEHKADIQICDNDGKTALHRAIQHGHENIGRILQEHTQS